VAIPTARRRRRARLLALMALGVMPLAAGCGSSSTSGSNATSAAQSQAPAGVKRPPQLSALLSSSGDVSITNSDGQPVTHLASGHYTLSINVESPSGDFRLIGPGFRRRTRPHFTGIVLWGLHLLKGTYRYLDGAAGKRASVHVISVS
jgi:hypothetical protein